MHHSEIDESLWDDVRRLPVKQRRAVVLRFAGDRSYPEIAAAMSTTQDSARQSVHEGLKKLRRDRIDERRSRPWHPDFSTAPRRAGSSTWR